MEAGGKRNYALLSGYIFCFFFAQAMAMSFLSIWLSQTLKLTGTEAGTVFSANAAASMLSQPLYGYLSDKMGLRKVVPTVVAAMVVCAGGFFIFVYEPLLRYNFLLGVAVGALYLGVTFSAGSFALESYVDRAGRRYGFEFSRVRMWGSLGFAAAAAMTGRLFEVDPRINFVLASCAGLLLLPLIFAARIAPTASERDAAARLSPRDTLAVLRQSEFWRFMVLILGVTNLYLVYDQQFPAYFASLFPTKAEGNVMFGYLNSGQIFVEAGMMFVAPWIVNRTGAKNGLLIATAIMIVRIAGSGVASGPLEISACKMLHAVELPILIVSTFRYIAQHFSVSVASTVYLVGVSFGHALGVTLLSRLAGVGYDRFGFPTTYFLIAGTALVFWLASAVTLSPDRRAGDGSDETISGDGLAAGAAPGIGSGDFVPPVAA